MEKARQWSPCPCWTNQSQVWKQGAGPRTTQNIPQAHSVTASSMDSAPNAQRQYSGIIENTKQGRKKGKSPFIPLLRSYPSNILVSFLLDDCEPLTLPQMNNFILGYLRAIILKNMFNVLKMLYKHTFKRLQILPCNGEA